MIRCCEWCVQQTHHFFFLPIQPATTTKKEEFPMKKVISLLLCLALVLGVPAAVSAEDADPIAA